MGQYMCCFCGKSYDDAESYAKCVRECAAKQAAEKEKKRQEELEANKQKRIAEIKAVEKQLIELKRNFNRDYGYYIDVLNPFEIIFG